MFKKENLKEISKGILITFIASIIFLTLDFLFITDNPNINLGDDSNIVLFYNPILIALIAIGFFLRKRKMLGWGILIGYPIFFTLGLLFITIACNIAGSCDF